MCENNDNFSKETYISYINIMVGLTPKELERLKSKSYEEVKHTYQMTALQNSDEQLI